MGMMKMNKKLVIVGVTLLLILSFSGCIEETPSEVIDKDI